MITQLIWTIWTSLSVVPRKAIKLNHSLTVYPWMLEIIDVITSKHFLHYWLFVRGINESLVDSLHKGPVIQTFYVSLESALTFEQTFEGLVIWDTMMLIWHHCHDGFINAKWKLICMWCQISAVEISNNYGIHSNPVRAISLVNMGKSKYGHMKIIRKKNNN